MKLTGHPTIRLKLLLLLSLVLLPLICCTFLLCRKMHGLKSTERTDIQMQLDDHVKVHVVYTKLLPLVARTHFLSGVITSAQVLEVPFVNLMPRVIQCWLAKESPIVNHWRTKLDGAGEHESGVILGFI